MSKESLEHLSSLMDGELSRETGLFMARRLSSDEALSGTWQRYHLIRDCIRQRGERSIFMDFTACVRSALAEEEAGLASAWQRQGWLKPAAGFAIAASVALMAIMAVGPTPQSGSPAINATESTAGPSFDSPNPLNAIPLSQPASFNSPATNSRLNSYLLRHNQLARSTGRQGFVPFVPIIATSVEPRAESPGPGPADEPEAGASSTPGADPLKP
jgi:sigma-E factor negative regulatory protein RseA